MSTPAVDPPSEPLTVVPYPDPVEGKYIVVLKDGTQGSDYSYGNITSWDHVLNGFCATLSQAELDELCVSSNVEAIYQDGYARIATVNDNVPLSAQEASTVRASMDASLVASKPGTLADDSQTNAPWGLQRIIQPGKLAKQNDRAVDFNYKWNQIAGRGVDVYVVDTGIDINHPQFEQRATWGTTFGGHPDVDNNGHGTHCAGTVGSRHFGVAKQVSLVAVKVLGEDGRGAISDIISGMNWVSQTAANTGRPSIVSMSLGGRSVSRPLDQAVASLTGRGIHVVVAAGNDAEDASNSSPARAPSANTVGSSRINDARSDFSNYGSVLELFAPGENIISTWHKEPRVQSLSGTSMACPHVSGALALLISISGNDSPAVWRAKLKSLAVKNALTDIRSGSPNLLLQVRST